MTIMSYGEEYAVNSGFCTPQPHHTSQKNRQRGALGEKKRKKIKKRRKRRKRKEEQRGRERKEEEEVDGKGREEEAYLQKVPHRAVYAALCLKAPARHNLPFNW